MLRYKMNVLEELKAIGISSYRIRQEKIMGESSMTRLRTGQMIHPETLDAICRLLNVQPGDIIEYVPDEELSAGDGEKQ